MPSERINDLLAFKGFIEEKLSQGETSLTLDEALMSWEIENQSEDEREETIEAIQLGDARSDRLHDLLEHLWRRPQHVVAQ